MPNPSREIPRFEEDAGVATKAETKREPIRTSFKPIQDRKPEIPIEHLQITSVEHSIKALKSNIEAINNEIIEILAEVPDINTKTETEEKLRVLNEDLENEKKELAKWEIKKADVEAFNRSKEQVEIITNVTDRGVPQAIAFPTREQPAEEPALVAPKKSWFAPVRKWGTRALVAFGLIAAAKPAAEEMERLGQAASQTYADYEKGIQSFVESSPRMREGVTKETAERLVAGQPVEIGGKTVQLPTPETGSARPTVDQDRFLRQDLPRMVEQARKTLGVESGLPAGYSETSFLNDQQTFQHFAEFGPGKNITMEVASKALGNMIKYNKERARAAIAKETRNQAAAQQAVDRIFGEKV